MTLTVEGGGGGGMIITEGGGGGGGEVIITPSLPNQKVHSPNLSKLNV